LADPDEAVRLAVLQRMLREKVGTRLTTLHRWLRARPGPESVAAIFDSLRDHSPDERRDVLAEVIGDRGHTPANRRSALALCPGGDEGMSQEELLDLAGSLEDGPVLAAAIRQVTKRSMPRAATLLVAKLGSPDPGVRAAAVEVGAALAVAGVGGRARVMLDDPDRGVRRTSLDSLRRLRDPRVVPVTVAALTDRETQLPALACIAELGGPSQADAVADLAKQSPTAEVLPLAVRILTDWGREPGRPTAERLGLDRAVAPRRPTRRRGSLCGGRLHASTDHDILDRSDDTDAVSGMPLTRFWPDCPNDATTFSYRNGCHPRPVNGYTLPMRAMITMGPFDTPVRADDPGPPNSRHESASVVDSGFDSSLTHRLREAFVIALNLIGIRHREGRDGLIKRIGFAEVAANQSRVTGTGVGARQRAPAPVGEDGHLGRLEPFDAELELHVA
jgi:HEAT repeat protein